MPTPPRRRVQGPQVLGPPRLQVIGYGAFDLADQARRAVDWMEGPGYKPGPRFDIGIATSKALRRVLDGVPAAEAGGRDEPDNGNGSRHSPTS